MKKLLSLLYLGTLSICSAQQPDLKLEVFASGFNRPTAIANAGDDRLFVSEQAGQIKIINADGSVNGQPFLNISNKINSRGNEQGLLGLAFHPQYAENGYFYVNYTDTSGNTVIERYSRSTNTSANPNSALILLTYDQPAPNHNGGHLTFGPDNMLYIGSGDGGGGGDRQNNSQNINKLLGKILRLDVDRPAPYIPQDNPFVNKTGRDEIWAYGLRNPWKFSFDGKDLWIADVGDNAPNGHEEVNKVVANPAEQNYGWRCYEGANPTGNANECNGKTLVSPFTTFERGGRPFRCSITGGFVYRGSKYTNMVGQYIFGDYCSNELLMVANDGDGTITSFGPFAPSITTFGVDQNNELYVGGHVNRGSDIIYRVVDNNNQLSTPSFSRDGNNVLYPNPADRFFKLKSENPLQELQLFDIKGQLVKEFQFQPSHQYNIDSLNKGIYLLKIKDQNGKEFHQKIVIEK